MLWPLRFTVMVFLLFLLNTSSYSNESDNIGLGPMLVSNWSPFEVGHLSIMPSEFPVQGSFTYSCVSDVMNYWSREGQGYIVDLELFSVLHRIEYDIDDRLTVGADISMTFRGGGKLDSLIENTHNLLGANQFLRDDYPRDCLMN